MAKHSRKKPNSPKHKHRTWELQEANAKFFELINEVTKGSYQTITKNGQPVVVLISQEEFEKLQPHEKSSLGEFLLNSPFAQLDLEI